jgi:metal-responsive CopG/Arc/MetJ family transcriptional regulator
MDRKSSRRKASEELVPVTIKLPLSLYDRLETALANGDTDRSKFTRNAIRAHLESFGLSEPSTDRN